MLFGTQSSGRRRRAGQSLVELAIALPVLMALLLGGFNTTILISDKVTAGYAARQGARLASELGGCPAAGGTSCPATVANQLAVDQKIVGNILAATQSMHYIALQEIDIYLASAANGVLQGSDKQDQFNGSGTALATQTFTLDLRNQTPPNETAIGVRIVWQYTTPTPPTSTLTFMDYGVMKAAPVLT